MSEKQKSLVNETLLQEKQRRTIVLIKDKVMVLVPRYFPIDIYLSGKNGDCVHLQIVRDQDVNGKTRYLLTNPVMLGYGDSNGTCVLPVGKPFVVGRQTTPELTPWAAEKISRVHLSIMIDAETGHFMLVDHSKNGTTLEYETDNV